MDRSTYHPLVEYCMRSFALPATSAGIGGTLSLLVDDIYRIQLVPLESGWVGVKSRLCALPMPGIERDVLLRRCGKFAMSMLRGTAAGMAVDPNEESLHLQQMLRPDCPRESMPEVLGAYLNALAKWRSFISAGEGS
ncbi:CesT family type III secretion system chaperone [Achromobacter marplatensis]|uniref:CesT family type III secretion system chaperone n=1 Tax=Achromobacter marplatensis TaxID=470868 RepID=UPI0039F6FAF4